MNRLPIPIEQLAHELRDAERLARLQDIERATRRQQADIEEWQQGQLLREARLSARKWRATCFVVAGLGVSSHLLRWLLEVAL